MNCPKCQGKLREVAVKIAGAKNKVKSYQCSSCDYFSFEEESSKDVLEELHKTPLKIQQKVVKLSHNRLGIYFNKDIIRSLGLESGEAVYVSVPDEKHILIELT